MAKDQIKHPTILLVEDDIGDQEITRRAFDRNRIHVDLRMADDGEEAMDYLRHRGKYADPSSAPRPDLILLDLNLPRMDGHAVLSSIRADPSIDTIPVIVLTTSSQVEDIIESYKLQCNSYITKPVDLQGFVSAVRTIDEYWLNLVNLPPAEARTQTRTDLSS